MVTMSLAAFCLYYLVTGFAVSCVLHLITIPVAAFKHFVAEAMRSEKEGS